MSQVHPIMAHNALLAIAYHLKEDCILLNVEDYLAWGLCQDKPDAIHINMSNDLLLIRIYISVHGGHIIVNVCKYLSSQNLIDAVKDLKTICKIPKSSPILDNEMSGLFRMFELADPASLTTLTKLIKEIQNYHTTST